MRGGEKQLLSLQQENPVLLGFTSAILEWILDFSVTPSDHENASLLLKGITTSDLYKSYLTRHMFLQEEILVLPNCRSKIMKTDVDAGQFQFPSLQIRTPYNLTFKEKDAQGMPLHRFLPYQITIFI